MVVGGSPLGIELQHRVETLGGANRESVRLGVEVRERCALDVDLRQLSRLWYTREDGSTLVHPKLPDNVGRYAQKEAHESIWFKQIESVYVLHPALASHLFNGNKIFQ
jgi:hypothetical protein